MTKVIDNTTLAFDIYGTLINPYAISTALEKQVGGPEIYVIPN